MENCSGGMCSVIGLSSTVAAASVTRMDVVNVPDVVATPRNAPVPLGFTVMNVGSGGPSCTLNPAGAVKPGVIE